MVGASEAEMRRGCVMPGKHAQEWRFFAAHGVKLRDRRFCGVERVNAI